MTKGPKIEGRAPVRRDPRRSTSMRKVAAFGKATVRDGSPTAPFHGGDTVRVQSGPEALR